jgi:O-antigen/teichoic acid export membrane protein
LTGVVTILTGSVAGQGLVLLSYPFLTRLYDPADFGLLTVFTAIVGIIGVVSAASLESAIPIPKDVKEAVAVAWAGLFCVGIVTACTVIVGFVAGTQIAALLGVPRLSDMWWLVPLAVLAIGVYLIFSEWMIRNRSYARLGRRNLLQGLGQVSTQVGLGLAGVKPLGLLLGLPVGRIFGVGGVAVRGGLLREPIPKLSAIKAAVRRYRRFPLIASWSNLLNTVGLEVPLLVIAALYGDVQAGLIGLTVRVIAGPATIIGQAVSQVFTGEVGARLRDTAGPLAPWVKRGVLRLLALGALPTVLLVLLGPDLFRIVFGEQWVDAGRYAQLLAVAYLAAFCVGPITPTLFLLERQGLELTWVIVRLTLTIGAPLACGLAGAPITLAIVLLSLAHVLSYVLLYTLTMRASRSADRHSRGGTEPA